MAHQVQVSLKYGIEDSLGNKVKAAILRDLEMDLESVETIKVYTIDTENKNVAENLEKITRELFPDPVLNDASDEKQLAAEKAFEWIIEIGSKPGVVDNPGKTSKGAIEDMLDITLDEKDNVYTSAQYLLKAKGGKELSKEDTERVANYLHNGLIMTAHFKTKEQFIKDNGMNIPRPKVDLPPQTYVDPVEEMQVVDKEGNLIPEENVNWEKIKVMGKKGVYDERKTIELRQKKVLKEDENFYRGPLALSLKSAKAIRDYFVKLSRNPTDVELESLAQTWSEHCNHSIFRDLGLFKTIQDTTELIRERKGKKDRCVSVFSDNSGVIRFTDDHDLCYKIETHNSPSALDPYGGAITGIVGVNRDPLGTGNGNVENTVNIYGFCFGDPNKKWIYKGKMLYKNKGRTIPLLHPKTIFEGVRKGVEDGGNKSGIPTSWGFLNFDEDYSGKPLVFVGTVGLMLHKYKGKKTSEKTAEPGYLIVMAGNRVGVDGVHGATFSSEIMGEGSPATAVQIGDPITQKMLADAQYEAAQKELFTAVTDNGAGGLSCSVPELCHSQGLGCVVDLDKVPLKYKGINPNEIWISESQERMTYLVPPDKITQFLILMMDRRVEATVIGKATAEKRCIVNHINFKGAPNDGGTVMDVDMEFLQKGLPSEELRTTYTPSLYQHTEPQLTESTLDSITRDFYSMLGRLNICSKEYVVRQFDHEVQGASAIKPLIGRSQDVHSDASVTRPLLFDEEGIPDINSRKAFALSHGVFPRLSFIDTEKMAQAAVDTAIRNIVAVGGNPDDISLLDNFCWCSSDEPERLGQLERAVKGACDAALAANAPYISGKDSMFNDFRGYVGSAPKEGPDEPIKISVPPTLLISSMGVIDNVEQCITHDFKFAGDLIYVLGETRKELGGSEYYAMLGEQREGEQYIGNSAPEVDMKKNMELYRAVHRAIKEGVVASCKSVKAGGLAVALAEMSMAGELGADIDLSRVVRSAELSDKNDESADKAILFSESMGRLIIAINPAYKGQFEEMMKGQEYACIGEVAECDKITMKGIDQTIKLSANIGRSKKEYKQTLDWGYHQHQQEAGQ